MPETGWLLAKALSAPLALRLDDKDHRERIKFAVPGQRLLDCLAAGIRPVSEHTIRVGLHRRSAVADLPPGKQPRLLLPACLPRVDATRLKGYAGRTKGFGAGVSRLVVPVRPPWRTVP